MHNYYLLNSSTFYPIVFFFVVVCTIVGSGSVIISITIQSKVKFNTPESANVTLLVHEVSSTV